MGRLKIRSVSIELLTAAGMLLGFTGTAAAETTGGPSESESDTEAPEAPAPKK